MFPLNWDIDKYIEITGKYEFSKGQEMLNAIPMYIEENEESVELWTQRVSEYIEQLKQTETRVVVVTDKAENELRSLESI